MNPVVSIIVPVYNAEKYLKRCVDSILNQEYRDFELLLADDGSTDSSGAICDEYAGQDSRVHVIHKENTGVSDSRNVCIDMARGTYLQFLDSDDWITPDATRLFVRMATEYDCDMVISDFYRVVGERVSHKGDIEEDGVLTREEFAAHMMENPADFYYGVIWNKLYRRDIIEKYHLRMDADISWCEDFMFNLEYILHAESFYVLNTPIYYYVKTKGSLVSQGAGITKTIKMKLMVFEVYNNFYKHVLDEEDYAKKRLQVYRFRIDAAGDGTVRPWILPGDKKLGDERGSVLAEAVAEDGILTEAYRNRKLLEYYMEPVALKNDLTLTEVKLLLYIGQNRKVQNRKELSDFTNMTKSKLNAAIQHLVSKGYIKVEENRSRKAKEQFLRINLLPASDAILKDLEMVQRDYDNTRFEGFCEEEVEQYARLTEKMKENIQRVLT